MFQFAAVLPGKPLKDLFFTAAAANGKAEDKCDDDDDDEPYHRDCHEICHRFNLFRAAAVAA